MPKAQPPLLTGGYMRIGGAELHTPDFNRGAASPHPRSTSMTPEHIHEIARLAAESASHMNAMTKCDDPTPLRTPAEAAENVVNAYLSAVKKLSAATDSAAPESAA